MRQKKLQNSFNEFLPANYRDFRLSVHKLTSNKAVVAELLRICCDEDDVKAIKIAFERILGKPEKVLIIKRTVVKMIYPEAKSKALEPFVNDRVLDEVEATPESEQRVVISEADAPGVLVMRMLDKIGESNRNYSYEVLEDKDSYDVAEVMAANLYGIAMRGANLSAITLLFDYLDGAVADVVRLEGLDTVLLESYADVAPYEAILGEDGVYYVERDSVL